MRVPCLFCLAVGLLSLLGSFGGSDTAEESGAVEVDGAPVGVARWVVWSYALGRNIAIALVDVGAPDDATFTVRAPDGPRTGGVHAIPFVAQ